MTALVGLGIWIAFVAAGPVALAWLGFAVLTLHNTFGDMLMVRGWRKRNPGVPGIAYFRAVKEMLRRPLALVHAWLAPVAWFGALFSALGF